MMLLKVLGYFILSATLGFAVTHLSGTLLSPESMYPGGSFGIGFVIGMISVNSLNFKYKWVAGLYVLFTILGGFFGWITCLLVFPLW